MKRIQKIIFSLFLLITFNGVSHSQVSVKWTVSYHFSIDEAKAIATDSSGNVYVTGNSGSDCVTIKYNTNGVQQWTARYTAGSSAAIAIDRLGNVYVTGSSTGPATASDFTTIKYNSAGVQQWSVKTGGTGNDAGYSIAVDDSLNVYATGMYYNTTPGFVSFNFLTIKYNSSGVIQWSKEYGSPSNGPDFAYGLALDNSGNVYVTGDSRGSGTSDDDFTTLKYNSAGTLQWTRIYNGPGDAFDNSKSIAVDKFANVYITGRSDGGTATKYDYCTIKYAPNGDSLWVKRFNGTESNFDVSTALATDTSGNVYVTGISLYSSSGYDIVTVKYDGSGTEQWFRRFDGPGYSNENAFSIAADASGNSYISGSSYMPGENYNYVTLKYNTNGDECWSRIYNGAGNGSDEAFAVALDKSGNAYVTGGSVGDGTLRDFVTIKYSPIMRASVKIIPEGLYLSASDKMISDTVRIFLRNSAGPYNIIDSSKAKLDSVGKGEFYFNSAVSGTAYFLEVKHRNSIETWSSTANYFYGDTPGYDFTTASSRAFGSNQKQVDASPVRYAIYCGDVDQNGNVNLADITMIYNNAVMFLSGYVVTDLNGDNAVNLTDQILAFNNSAAFVARIVP